MFQERYQGKAKNRSFFLVDINVNHETLVGHLVRPFVGILHPVSVMAKVLFQSSQRGKKNHNCAGKSPSNKVGFASCAFASKKSVSPGAKVRPTNSRQIKTFKKKKKK